MRLQDPSPNLSTETFAHTPEGQDQTTTRRSCHRMRLQGNVQRGKRTSQRRILWQFLLLIVVSRTYLCKFTIQCLSESKTLRDAFCDNLFLLLFLGASLCVNLQSSLWHGHSPQYPYRPTLSPLRGTRPDNNKKKLSQNASTGQCPEG